MQDGQSRALQRLRGTAAAKAEVRQDAKSRLQKLAQAVGNEEVGKRIHQGNANRDEMLAFVLQQLEAARELQRRELALTRKEAGYSWWKAFQNQTVAKPEPTRWKTVARAFEDAARAICKGDLRRGKALLDAAIAEQQHVAKNTTTLVDQGDLGAGADPSELAELVAQTPVAGACQVPEEIRDVVDEIERVETHVKNLPDDPRVQDPWWTLDDEDEEEANGGGGGGGGAA